MKEWNVETTRQYRQVHSSHDSLSYQLIILGLSADGLQPVKLKYNKWLLAPLYLRIKNWICIIKVKRLESTLTDPFC